MSGPIDTRDGTWREVAWAEWNQAPAPTLQLHGTPPRYFVHVEPVPPLPTNAGTVIAIGEWWFVKNRPWMPGTNLEREQGWTLLLAPTEVVARSMARASFGFKAGDVYDVETVTAEFEQEGEYTLISEPRAVTAKTVLDRLWDWGDLRAADAAQRVAPEFGVES